MATKNFSIRTAKIYIKINSRVTKMLVSLKGFGC